MADLTQDWNALATNIRGIGQDQFNAGLGLARFISEDAGRQSDIKARDAETAIKKQELIPKEIAAREALIAEKKLNEPVTLRGALDLVTGGNVTNTTVAATPGILSAVNIKLADETNPDTILLSGKTNKPLTGRELKDLTPVIAGYTIATTDPLVNMKRTVDNMQTAFDQDPNNQELATKLQSVKTGYEAAVANPTEVYRQQLSVLTKVKGMLKSYGGDITDLNDKEKTLQTVIAQGDKQNTAREYTVTDKTTSALGLPVGTRIDSKLAETGGQGLTAMTNKAAAIDSAELMKTAQIVSAEKIAAGNVKAAQINKDAQVAVIESNKQMQAANTFLTSVDPTNVRKLVAESLDKILKPDAAGRVMITDPKTKEPRVLSSDEIVKMVDQESVKQITNKWQSAQDSGQLEKLGMVVPPGIRIDRSPVPVRQAMDQQISSIVTQVNKIPETDALGKNLSAQLSNVLRSAVMKRMTGDPAQIDAANKDVLSATTSLQQYLDSKKAPGSIKQEIVKKTKESASSAGGFMGSGVGLSNFLDVFKR